MTIKRLVCASILQAIFSFSCHAGGLFVYEVAASDVRLASAGRSARANDPSTVFSNPAGMSLLGGNTFQFGIEPIYAHIDFQPNASTTVSGNHGDGSTWLPSGSFFATTQVNDRLTAGFATCGYWGAGLNYGRNWVGRYYVTEALMEGISAIPSLAFQVNDQFSVGVGANLMYSILLSKAAVNNVLDGLPDGSVRLLDTRFGAGAILGALYQFSPGTRIGVQYTSPVKLHFRDKPKFHQVGPTLTAALAATGLLDSTTRVTIQVPANVTASIYHEMAPRLAVMGDVGWQQWSKFNHVEIMVADLAATTLAFTPQYQDTWHVALGMEYCCANDLTVSAGVAYDTSMLTTSNRTFSLPIGHQWRFGTGLQYQYQEGILLDAAYELTWSGQLPIDQNRGALVGRVAGDFRNACIQFFNVSLTYCF
ncbi:MAG: outer membrane protein transport protein [Chlamydiales bacterium]|nr:outer membrane protein transport protein [Chlamydiales bacterium]